MNRENIQKVRDVIAALPPELFNMKYFGKQSECGTVACIAGWTVDVLGRGIGWMPTIAQRHFGISNDQATELFWVGHRDAGHPYWKATNAQAVRVLDHLLETGEVDWSIIDAPSPSSDRGGS